LGALGAACQLDSLSRFTTEPDVSADEQERLNGL